MVRYRIFRLFPAVFVVARCTIAAFGGARKLLLVWVCVAAGAGGELQCAIRLTWLVA